jgi:D-alanyl-D-alanine carboxypeptidase/D-alanyl-D-alanine-endopeptidase (penicillin-binding protein 4)
MGGCRSVVVALFVGWASSAVVCAQRGALSLPQAVAQAEQLGARTGVAAVELDGAWRHRHRATERFLPASNMKLLSAAAVLHGLGRDFQFETRFELRGGRLIVVAGGDPNWITGTAHSPEVLWRGVIAALLRQGVRSLRGVTLDERPFTGPSRPPTWPQDQLDTYYCAPTGGLVLDQGTFRIAVKPTGAAADASLVAPFVGMPVEGSIAVVATKKGAVYGAVDLGDRVRVQGKVYRGANPQEITVAVREPLPWFERALGEALEQAGIRIDADAPCPEDSVVYVHRTPLQPALVRMLEASSNFDAEQLVRVLGAKKAGDGSLAGGAAALRSVLDRALGSVGEELVQVDGSGLSRGNEVTPSLLVRALRVVCASDDADMFLAALPVAGETGTLEGRFEDSPVRGRVRAKTGWIRGASSLSGILERKDGSRCAFAILMNYDPRKNGLNGQLKELQESIVEALDRVGRDG